MKDNLFDRNFQRNTNCKILFSKYTDKIDDRKAVSSLSDRLPAGREFYQDRRLTEGCAWIASTTLSYSNPRLSAKIRG